MPATQLRRARQNRGQLVSVRVQNSNLDEIIGRVAEQQHGVFAVHHLDAIGVTQQFRHHRLAHGRWVSPYAGVFRIAGTPRSWKSELVAATWAGGDRAVASHRSAAALWAISGGRTDRLELTCPRWRRARHDGLVVHESTRLDATDTTIVDGIRCTTVERTIFDLCACVGPVTVDLAIDAALRRDLTSIGALLEVHDRLATKGRRGGRRFRDALASRTLGPLHESPPERLVARALVAAGLPEPVAQHVVRVDGRFIARVDLAYGESRIAIEYDSFEHHTGKVALVRDSTRRNALAAAGWTVLSVTAVDLRNGCRQLARDLNRLLSREVASLA
jgi:predicted transcriptional regulator of viral defense system